MRGFFLTTINNLKRAVFEDLNYSDTFCFSFFALITQMIKNTIKINNRIPAIISMILIMIERTLLHPLSVC